MSTIVFVHAHPDDEASQTSGSMARLCREGHRVVVVYCTNGDHGSAPADLGGKTLVEYRRGEAEASAGVLGTARVAWLGYADSGMSGWEQNAHDGSFHAADIDEAARVLAGILDEEDADVVVGYDWHGGYGHPDHVQCHRVTKRAAELAARRPRYLEETMNRDEMRRGYEQAVAAGAADTSFDPDTSSDDGVPVGEPESAIHWQVDVRDLIETKRAALACHASQADDVGMMLQMPPDLFLAAFGFEYYIEPGRPPGMQRAWPFATS